MNREFNSIDKVNGELILPGDKSVSHRSVMFSALAEGISKVENCLMSEDVRSTISCFEQMGCEIEITGTSLKIKGRGPGKLKAPESELYAGNSGTTSRLISGILAAQNFRSVITGDESLSSRPMKRVAKPLREMGADITLSEKETLPMIISPAKLKAVEYRLPVASAQVKSAVLLAGLHLEETTVVIEDTATRNHTETMLGLDVKELNGLRYISVSRDNYPVAANYNVPSDISSAAFFMVLASILKHSEIKIYNVLLNETRDGILRVLNAMGADIQTENTVYNGGEKSGNLIIRSAELKNISIEKAIVPNLIDEIPVLSVAGLFAEGEFEIRNAEELRVKETDRINAMCVNFRHLGLDVDEYPDGFKVSGKIKNIRPEFQSFGDHRIAMAFAIYSLASGNGGKIEGFECVNISNPDFLNQLKSII